MGQSLFFFLLQFLRLEKSERVSQVFAFIVSQESFVKKMMVTGLRPDIPEFSPNSGYLIRYLPSTRTSKAARKLFTIRTVRP